MPAAGGPTEREPKLARRSPFAPATRLCPRCLSPLKIGNELSGWMTPLSFYCEKCGYSGSVYLEKDPESEKGNQ